MPDGRNIHRRGIELLSAALVVIGVALIVRTLVAGGGAGALGIVLGVLFVLAGAGRLWASWRTG
jgi:hypothetical protein